jgi:hypothetical protein
VTEEERPLAGYAGLFAIYGLGVAAFAIWAGRSGRALPPRLGPGDLILSGIATHKASRLIGRDKVTAWIRRPFTEEEEDDIAAELSETARGRGLRRAVGELIHCPYCLGQWIATAIVAGHAVAPRATRSAVTVLSIVAISDFLQPAYRLIQEQQG